MRPLNATMTGLFVVLPIASSLADHRPQGSIVGWGSQVVGVDLSHGFVQVAAGDSHSLGLKADGSSSHGDPAHGPRPTSPPQHRLHRRRRGRESQPGSKD
jgi:hypothetical protein